MKTALHNVVWLLWREFLEHRRLVTSGFWLAVLMAALNLVFVLVSVLGGSADLPLSGNAYQVQIETGDRSVLDHLSLSLQKLGAADLADVSQALAILGYAIGLLFAIAFGAVIVSYGLSCLYDERRDRSVLFWKSLPVSDTQTIGAKFIFGLVVLLPAWTLATLLAIWLSIGVYAATTPFLGGPVGALLADTHLLAISVLVLAALPIYLLSLAPAVAWLMLCSTVGGRHRALMAFLIPAFFALVNAVSVANPMWHLLIARLFPIGFVRALSRLTDHHNLLGALETIWHPLITPQLWIGVLIAILCLLASSLYRQRYAELS
ncbi:hypothetical protein [Salinisphaera sp. Q1T1-3]|uniref:hypothetical protein n=1 Tax=Salinisphaera sp. Q1T1-3 TaxID=2321229 RepID=UPI000E755038|nr:hypothetical protein [Salinisphaera sp. Q1T1-3]RJS94072.1 hypothetical protein D3260_05745 [Salinisphaera sp. Q1T1-3]